MKKINYLVLMAAMLLIGTNVWADNTIKVVYHNGTTPETTFSDLQAAINSVAAGDSATITLLAPQLLDKGIVIPNVTKEQVDKGAQKIVDRAGQRICIDLNGKSIKTSSMTKNSVISLVKGTLHITGAGTIARANVAKGSSNWERGAIIVSGTDGRDETLITAEKPDRSKQEWSVLIIDKDVEVTSVYDNTFGIGVQEIGPNLPSWGTSTDVLGYTTKYTGTTAEGSEESAPMWTKNKSKQQYSAFGVKLMIAGTVYGHTRGINVVGNINQTPKDAEGHTARTKDVYPYYDRNYPYIYIASTADVSCIDEGIEDNGNGGVYLGGWAILDISGAVHGQTGVFVKSGDVKVIDGNVYSEASLGENSGNYHDDVSGSGIFIASDAGYAGNASVSVEGDSHIQGAGGSAIVDVIATNTTETQVSHVTITGGTIEGGDQGAINLTTPTSEQTAVTGGSVSGTVTVGVDDKGEGGTTVSVTTLVPNNDDYHTTSVTDPETGQTTVVVSQGTAPVGDANVAAGHNENSQVKWTGDAETISADLTLKELEINENKDQTLTIQSGKTLSVGRVVLGGKAQIIVEAGAKFIVTDPKQGITSASTSNVVLRTSTTSQALFLVHPDTKSGRHPDATVELYSRAKALGDKKYQWQRFGVPACNDEVSLAAIEFNGTKYPTSFEKFEDGNYVVVKPADWADTYLEPFRPYAATTSNTAPDDDYIYTFRCKLVGNDDAALEMPIKWNFFANSYSAPINISEFISDIRDNYTHISGTIYLHNAVDNVWYEVNNATTVFHPEYASNVDPMQAFAVMRRSEGANPVVDYEEQVYNPIVSPAPAPARANGATFATAVVEIVAADGTKDEVSLLEGEPFSAEFDNTYDAAKLMNLEQTYIYADGKDEKLGIIATDNLEGTTLSIAAKEQTSFIMTVSRVNGLNYAIRDMLTGTEVELTEGATYMFTVPANTNVDGRFQIVGVHKVPTAIDNVEEVAATKGIYNMAGQYMGNDFHSLSAGVYVVDGKKVVK